MLGDVACFVQPLSLYTTPHPPYFPAPIKRRIRRLSAPDTRKKSSAMRAETQTLADEIKQSLALLRRHL
ncbi:MAG: hypothetical protein RIC34_12790 [Parvibaculum sp.]|jgi:hypothetical protein|uniref:hypothetical protein n=1 Tax=Parvibaculum sp. TaxID=2024848 RepID=UPI0032ED1628